MSERVTDAELDAMLACNGDLFEDHGVNRHTVALYDRALRELQALRASRPATPLREAAEAVTAELDGHAALNQDADHVRIGVQLGRLRALRAALAAPATTPPYEPAVLADIRAAGWSVAIHNDYVLHGKSMTFWGFTKGDRWVKGEGCNDAEAIDSVRAQLGMMIGPEASHG